MTDKHILSTNHYYYLKMTSAGGLTKFIKVDMSEPYYSINDVFTKMNNYVKDGICWKVKENKIYMCQCDIDESESTESVENNTSYSRYKIWFIKIKNVKTGNIFYYSTANNKIYPSKSFKEVFNNTKIPEGYVIDDYDHLYISNVTEE